MQLQQDVLRLRASGLGLAAISYDSRAVLKEFARRKSISYPLLSDHESEVIRSYGVADQKYGKGMRLDVYNEQVYLNTEGYVPVFGVSYPAVFVLGRDGRVKWRFVSEGPELRLTGAAILEQAVGGIAGASRTPVPTRNIQVTATATNTSVRLGTRLGIALELKIPAGFHVYSPEVGSDYKGVSWQMDASECLEMGEPVFPKGQMKFMKSTDETLPVFEGTIRISREIIVKPVLKASDPSVFQLFCKVCLDPAPRLKASGVLNFQVCDEQRCFPPQTVRPRWQFTFNPPDMQRSPDELKREFEPPEPKPSKPPAR